MKIRKKIKKGYLLAVAALLALPCINLMQAQAAREIDLNRECSLTVSVEAGTAAGSSESYLEDFNQMAIPVSVYRVADVDVTGNRFTPLGAFENMDFDGINQRGSAVTADEWMTLAKQAEEIRKEENPKEDGSVTVQKADGSSGAAFGTITGLTPGMYLVAPKSTYNTDYTVEYTFAPYLTALPGNHYTEGGTESDDWIYDTTVGLKPDAVPQYGKLNITKILQNYNETLGRTTFVFHITGVDKDGAVRYEEVESMTYHAAGSNTITLERIPAGLTITVEEVYSGASYEAVGSNTETTLLWSDAGVSAGIAEESSVTFENRYGGGNRGGYGVTNHFESDGAGGWIWQNPTTPAEQ